MRKGVTRRGCHKKEMPKKRELKRKNEKEIDAKSKRWKETAMSRERGIKKKG